MKDLDRKIRARVEAFVEEITELIRRAALDAVAEALGSPGKSDRAPLRRAERPRARVARSKAGKRSAEQLDQLTAAIAQHVSAHPGVGAREIAAELGVTTKDLVLPIKKLLDEGSLARKGQKRATKYYRGKK